MKKITLVKRALAAPSPMSYGIELEVIAAEDINKEIFVKQRITKPDNKYDDVFVAIATPAQMQDLDVDSPAADSSYFRVKKISLVASHSSYLEDVVRTVLAEVQLLVDNEEAISLLEDEAIYVVTADNVQTSLVPVSLASSSGEYKSATLNNPNGADNFTLFYTTRQITVRQLVAVLTGSSSPTVTWSLRFSTNRSASGTELKPGGFISSSTTTGEVFTTFTNPVIPANSFVWVTTTGVTGVVNSLDFTLVFS